MKKLIGILAAALVLSGCSSTLHQIADEELTPGETLKAYHDILIIGYYDDRPYRVSAETLFAEVLKSKGVEAEPSYDLLPQLDNTDSDALLMQKLKDGNHDSMIIVATVDEGYDFDLEDYYATKGMFSLMGFRTGKYYELGSFISWAGSGRYELYVGLWDAGTLKPVWQITTHSTTSGSDTDDNKALAEFVYEKLREKGLL